MAHLLAFAGSNSSKSINYQLIKYTVSQMSEHEVQLLNLANFPFPMYSIDYEEEHGFSNSLIELSRDIKKADGIVISVNEHNGNPSAYFKNLLDWLSRFDRNFFQDAKILLMGTSPGRGGAANAIKVVNAMIPRFGGEVVTSFSLPSFNHTFTTEKGITEPDVAEAHKQAVAKFLKALNKI